MQVIKSLGQKVYKIIRFLLHLLQQVRDPLLEYNGYTINEDWTVKTVQMPETALSNLLVDAAIGVFPPE
jgi:hypothetical protein